MNAKRIEKGADKIVEHLGRKVAEEFTGDPGKPLTEVFNEHGQPARNMMRSLLQMNAQSRPAGPLKEALLRRAQSIAAQPGK